MGSDILATGAGTEEQTEKIAPTDGRFEVARAPETDFGVIRTLKEQWSDFDTASKKFWQSAAADKRNDTEVLTFPPESPSVARPRETDKPVDNKPSLPLLSINQMVGKFPDLKSLVYGSGNAPTGLNLDVPTDREFRAQYVKSIQEMSRNHGLTDKQVQDVILKLYAYETGGTGGFDLVAGMKRNPVSGATDKLINFLTGGSNEIPPSDHDYVPDKSSAIGYKQLIMSTTMSNVFTDGNNMSRQLLDRANASSDPADRERLTAKADFVGKLPDTMLRYANESYLKDHPGADLSKVAKWTLFDALSKSANSITLPDGRTMTGREFASSVQALNLDRDIGPLIQATQLRSLIQDWHPDSTITDPSINQSNDLKTALDNFVTHAQDQIKSFDGQPLDAKLKALNSILDQAFAEKLPSGMDGVMRDAVLRKMTESFKTGADPNFNEGERKFLFDKLLLNKVFLDPNLNGKSLSDSPEGQNISGLFYKLNSLYYGGLNAESLTPAVFEMANLLGAPQAKRMLDPAHSDWRTVNFTDQRGYSANPMLPNRRAAELLLAIHRIQNGPKADDSNAGIRAFKELFARPQ